MGEVQIAIHIYNSQILLIFLGLISVSHHIQLSSYLALFGILASEAEHLTQTERGQNGILKTAKKPLWGLVTKSSRPWKGTLHNLVQI